MLFHANAVLKDRQGESFTEPKKGAKPLTNARGEPTGFADDDLREVRHGDIAMMALDTTLKTDEKEMEADPAKWVRSVTKRDKISTLISTAMEGDGWLELTDDQRDIIVDRLAQHSIRFTLAMTGPVVRVLQNPPTTKE